MNTLGTLSVKSIWNDSVLLTTALSLMNGSSPNVFLEDFIITHVTSACVLLPEKLHQSEGRLYVAFQT